MIFTIPLQAGTLLTNVLYKWLVSGAFIAPSASGITQPDASFPMFRIDTGATAPVGAEELIAYDSTDVTNWNAGGYRAGLEAVKAAQQVLLVSLMTPGSGAYQIAPASSPFQSIARLYGIFTDLSAVSVDGIAVTLTLVQVNPSDNTLLSDMSGTLIKNKETGLLISQREIKATIVAGQLQDLNGNNYVALVRTDYMQDQNGVALANMRYLLVCPELGAPVGFSLIDVAGPTQFLPVTFVLDQTNLMVSGAGTLDLSKLKPN